MSGGSAMTHYQIKIETDEVGRAGVMRMDHSMTSRLADMWDHRKSQTLELQKGLHLRLFTAALTGSIALVREGLAEGADVNLR